MSDAPSPARRMLWLMLATIVVPVAILGVYGITGIRNGEAISEERALRRELTHLRQAAAVLAEELATVERGVVARAQECPDGLSVDCPLSEDVAALWVWPNGETPPSELVGRVPAEVPPGGTHWFADATGQLPIAVFRENGRVIAWRLDPDRLEQRLQDAAGLPIQLEPGAGAPRSAEALPLAPPLSGWHLALEADPVEAAAPGRRAAWQYAAMSALLGVFVIGVVLVLRAGFREARRSTAQSQWVSSLGHEIRTPLTSIQLFAETLRSGRVRDPKLVDEALGTLARESERLSRRAEQVLHWARAEAGRPFYRLMRVPPERLLEDAVEALQAQVMESGVVLDVEPGLPEIEVDRDAVVEALLNLLQNAWKFTPPPRHVRIFATQRGKWVGLGVEDDGPGIARAHHRRIFDRFYRTSHEVEGSGLGLAIVKAVVRGHRGKVEIDSEEERGTRFTLWFRT